MNIIARMTGNTRSLHATTADYVRFANGERFLASLSGASDSQVCEIWVVN